jgi:hypothetical protein
MNAVLTNKRLFLLVYCMALELVYLSKHGGESNSDLKQDRQCAYNMTLWRDLAAIVLGGKSIKYYIF